MLARARKANNALSLVIAAAVAIVTTAPVVCRADPTEQMRVSYADLNLSSPAGARQLYSRIEQAANSVCGTSNSDVDVIMRGPGPCVKAAIESAVHAINRSALSEVYLERTAPSLRVLESQAKRAPRAIKLDRTARAVPVRG